MHKLTFSVADILGRPGEYRDLIVKGPVEGVATALATLEPAPVNGSLRVESVVEGVLVTGSVRGSLALECARCLKGFQGSADVQVCELFAAPGHEVGDDAYQVTGLEIDLEPMLREALTLELPLRPLCRDDCKGLCAHCGRDLNDGPCACTDDEIDPRWAGLTVLKDQLGS